MSLHQNIVATKLTEKAFKLHDYIFNMFYQCPLQVKVENGQAAVKLDHVFQLKYIPFLIFSVFLTATILPGSCIFILICKLFFRNSFEISAVKLVSVILVGSCALCQLGNIILYFKFNEIEEAMNQIFDIERKCEFKIKKKMNKIC